MGFGDLSAASDPGRAFVMVEAIFGQLFLVTMLARVVGMLGLQRDMMLPGTEPDEPRPPPGLDEPNATATAAAAVAVADEADR